MQPKFPTEELPFVVPIFATCDAGPVFLGSGVVLDDRHVLTCWHVIEQARNARLSFAVRLPGVQDLVNAKSVAADVDWDAEIIELDDPAAISNPAIDLDGLPIIVTDLNEAFYEFLPHLDWRVQGYPWNKRGDAQTVYDHLQLSGRHADTTGMLETIKVPDMGFEAGCSGGPALIRFRDRWYCFGIATLGRREAATSLITAADRFTSLTRRKSGAAHKLASEVWQSCRGEPTVNIAELDAVLEKYSADRASEWDRDWTDLDQKDFLAYYVPPRYSLLTETASREIGLRFPSATESESPAGKDRFHPVKGESEEQVLGNLLSHDRLCVFEGPGAGKSIFTRRVQAYFSDPVGQKKHLGGRPGLAVRWESWGQAHWPTDFATALADALTGYVGDSEARKRLAKAAIGEGRVVLILDALDQLDEVVVSTRLQALNEFLKLTRRSGQSIRVVMTGRPLQVEEQRSKVLQDPSWQFARIEPFNLWQQYRYLRGPKKRSPGAKSDDAWSQRDFDWGRVTRLIDAASDEASAEESLEKLVPTYGDRIGELMSNPAVLAMIRQLSMAGKLQTFRSRAELYAQTSLRMIERAKEKLDRGSNVSTVKIETILAALACEMMVRNPESYRVDGMDAVYPVRTKAAARVSGGVSDTEWRLIDSLPGATSRSFLSESGGSRLAWHHKGMMEFYCGLHLIRNEQSGWVSTLREQADDGAILCGDIDVLRQAANPQWREPYLFAIELAYLLPTDNVLLASLSALFEPPNAKHQRINVKYERPTELMFYAWGLLEPLTPRDWYDDQEPPQLPGGAALIERFRRPFREISENPSDLRHEIATALLSNFVRCPPTNEEGEDDLTFWLGSPKGEPGRRENEPIQYRWSITEAFEMGRYPVTNAEYELFDCNHARSFLDELSNAELDQHPVADVSWYSAWMFAAWLGPECRLPTEREWEFACRAGTETPFHFGDRCNGSQANCDGTADPKYGGAGAAGVFLGHTSPVGAYPANAFGLYDLHGNVLEWCETWYAADFKQGDTSTYRGSARVLRGGSWNGDPVHCRSAFRDFNVPSSRIKFVGFRVARAPSRKP